MGLTAVDQPMLASASPPPVDAQGSRHARIAPAFFAIGLVSVLVSLLIRVIHRGGEVPGWDILLTVEGQFLLATRGLWGALEETFIQVRLFWLPPSAYSLPYGLVPGALAWWWPASSLVWQPLIVFAAWLCTLALLLRATGWRLSSTQGWAIALLCWGAAPALLSYAVEGYPWGGGMLPHVLALALALSRPPWRWTATLLALVVIWELPWHGYEIGKTAGLTLFVGAALAPRLGWGRRLLYAAVGGTQVWAAMWLWRSHNMIALEHGNVGTGVGMFGALRVIPDGLAALGTALFGAHPLIVPTLAVSGAVALVWSGSRRRVLVAVWALHLGLVVLLAAAGPNLLRARRFQGVETLAIAGMLAGLPRAPRFVRNTLLAILVAGNAWTVADGVRFARVGVAAFSLPSVESAEGVGMVDRASNAWARALTARAQAGELVVLLHGQSCITEDVTNPVGVLERMYLHLGHDRFREQVLAVSVPQPRYVTVPVVDLRAAMHRLNPGTILDMDSTCAPRMTEVIRTLEQRFVLERLTPPAERFTKFRLAARPPGG